jgi:hypothetical protein
MGRKLKKVTLYENRSADGWPHCLGFEYSEGFPDQIQLTEQSEYSQVDRIVKAINSAIRTARR